MEDSNNIHDCSFATMENEHHRQEKVDRNSICSTQLSDLSLYRSSISTIHDQCFEPYNNFEYNFKKTGSQWHNSRIIEEQNKSCLIKTQHDQRQKGPGNKSMYSKEISQFEDIEKRTESLVLKEKQQRKQLKKLKKIYGQTMAEYQLLKDKYLMQEQEINTHKESFRVRQENLQQQKGHLIAKISQLQLQIQQVEKQLRTSISEKQILWRKLQLLDANCQCRYEEDTKTAKGQSQKIERIQQIISYSDELSSLRREIQIIDDKIQAYQIQTPTYSQLSQIIRLYQLRKHYNSNIQQLISESQSKKYENIIWKLNRIILNTYRKIQAQTINSKKETRESQQQAIVINKMVSDDKGVDTTDTLLSKSTAQSKYLQTDPILDVISQNKRNQNKWDRIKAQVQNVIERNMISTYREIYQDIGDLAIGIIEMCQIQSKTNQFVSFVEGVMQHLNSYLNEKAEKQYRKISSLMEVIKIDCLSSRNRSQ